MNDYPLSADNVVSDFKIDDRCPRLAACWARYQVKLLFLSVHASPTMRYIIVNPDGPWIQGDLHARSAEEASARLEAKLSMPTTNDVWLIFEVPAGFPAASSGYSSQDPVALSLLSESYHLEVRNGFVPDQPDLFQGPGM